MFRSIRDETIRNIDGSRTTVDQFVLGFVAVGTLGIGKAISSGAVVAEEIVAEEGAKLALSSDIILSGGRSGQLVKNLTGPANSVLKGSGQRIFITDYLGRVIWDVTKDRAKSVIPGQGFGTKIAPTQQLCVILPQQNRKLKKVIN
jgi:hypothetical protein